MAVYDPTEPLAVDGTDETLNFESDQEQGSGEDEDYDPSSFNFDNGSANGPDVEALLGAHPTATKPKTIGGFVVDSGDEEEDDDDAAQPPPPSQMNGTEGAHSGLGAVAVAEAEDVNTPLRSEPQEDTAAVPSALQTAQNAPPNGSTSVLSPIPDVPSSTIPSAMPISSQNLSAPSEQGKVASPAPVINDPLTPPSNVATAASATPRPTKSSVVQTSGAQRLPHDKVGQLEDRIKDDPKADTQAWKSLISHYREKGQLDNARKIYSRFFEVFPSAATEWAEFARMELENEEMRRVEDIFSSCLTELPNVQMWTLYLDYLRRIHPLINDSDGSKRAIIASAFEVSLDHVGIDPEAGPIWREYVEFVKSGPGTAGGTGWQDQQKMDLMRKAYQRAIRLPHSEFAKLWKEYDLFELAVNKNTSRKILLDQSPHYMTARGARAQLEQKLEGLDRNSIPVLPPLYDCHGEDQFATQVEKWRGFIEWEKEDPLVLKVDEIGEYRKRVAYAYKQATMQLYFYPQIWFEAASWCFEQETQDMVARGDKFLEKGITACPESVLLALMKADRLEASLEPGNTDDIAIKNGEKLDVPYESVLTTLYALMKKLQERQKKAMDEVKEHFASLPPADEEEQQQGADNDDDDERAENSKSQAQLEEERLKDVRSLHTSRTEVLKRTISYVWVAKMRAFRRIQGQGTPGKLRKGFRGVFGEARPRGQLSSDVYVASALMEWHCYKDPSASKIFERGLKLFPTDESFALEYIKFLISRNDDVNARAVFETTITKITQNATLTDLQKREKCRGLTGFMHQYESSYGDLAQIHRLEKRMKELYPEEPDLAHFAHRFELPGFDPIQVQLTISPTQALPKTPEEILAQQPPVPTIEQQRPCSPPDSNYIRLGPNGPYVASPKRPLEDSDSEAPRRKFARGDSPLKGAAGRRLQNLSNSSNALNPSGGNSGFVTKSYVPQVVPAIAAPAPLPDSIQYLLSIIPRADLYRAIPFNAPRLGDILRNIDVAAARPHYGT